MGEMMRATSFKPYIMEMIALYPILKDTPESSILKILIKKGLEKVKEEGGQLPQQSQHNASFSQQSLIDFFDFDVLTDDEYSYLDISV